LPKHLDQHGVFIDNHKINIVYYFQGHEQYYKLIGGCFTLSE